jgi:hypothetical protein
MHERPSAFDSEHGKYRRSLDLQIFWEQPEKKILGRKKSAEAETFPCCTLLRFNGLCGLGLADLVFQRGAHTVRSAGIDLSAPSPSPASR